MFTYELQGEQLHLLPEKAIYWPSQKTLLIADSHLGKIRHFRKSGIAIPGRAGYRNLTRLQDLLVQYEPRKVIFLGDLFHSEMNFEWLEFKAFLEKFKKIVFVLIQGNHDIFHELSYKHFEVHQKPMEYGPFLLSHEPVENENSLYNLCGHIHPGVRMLGQAKQSMRLPCFYFGKKQGVLPAFGVFTGLHLLKPGKGDHIFIIAGSEVFPAS
jgi:DNA ligase-associated metallophosphoesterase